MEIQEPSGVSLDITEANKNNCFHRTAREKVQNVWYLVPVLGAGLAAFALLRFLIAGCGPGGKC